MSFIHFAIAHDVKTSTYNINQTKETIEVNAEIPWLLREALFQFDEKLENKISKQDFLKVFYKYIKSNFIIYDSQLNEAKLIKVEEVKRDFAHFHQNQYKFTFKSLEIHSVTNTILFDLNSKQNNLNILHLNSENIKFETSINKPTFILKKGKTYTLEITFLILTCIILIILLKNKRL